MKKGAGALVGQDSSSIFFRNPKDNVPVLVCNKHVIKNSIHGDFVFNGADNGGRVIYGQPIACSFDEFYKVWIFHPDPKIDLAVMPIGGLLNHLLQIGKRVYYTSISS
jgi:hypothetical protein